MSAPATVESLVARALLWGGLLSLTLIAIGLAGYAVEGAPNVRGIVSEVHAPHVGGAGPDVYRTAAQVARALARRPPEALALAALGLVCLLATPVVGVALAISAFWRRGDREYAAIAAAVLGLLLTSFALAAAG